MSNDDYCDKNVHNDVHHRSSVYVTVSGALPAHLPPPAAHFPQIAPIYLFATLSHTSIRPFYPFFLIQDKVNTADSAFIQNQSQNQWSGWSGRWSCMVWSLLER